LQFGSQQNFRHFDPWIRAGHKQDIINSKVLFKFFSFFFKLRLCRLKSNCISDVSVLGLALATNTTLQTLEFAFDDFLFYLLSFIVDGVFVLAGSLQTRSVTFLLWGQRWSKTRR
jgi:hypothetical protein